MVSFRKEWLANKGRKEWMCDGTHDEAHHQQERRESNDDREVKRKCRTEEGKEREEKEEKKKKIKPRDLDFWFYLNMARYGRWGPVRGVSESGRAFLAWAWH